MVNQVAAQSKPNEAAPVANAIVGLLIANATVFVSSFCIMVLELVAGRVITPYVGTSLYTWTSIIGIVLAGIAVGNYFGGRLADRFATSRTRAKRVLAILFILAGVIAAGIGFYNSFFGTMPFLKNLDEPRLRIALHVTLVFFLPCFVIGHISPVVAKSALDLGLLVGRTMGSVYAWGVVGSIIGTFMTGFFFVAVMKTSTIILSVAALLVAMGVLYGIASVGPPKKA